MKPRMGGFAMILVIWGLVLLASLASGFSMAVRHESRAATDLAAIAEAEAAATAALHITVLQLSQQQREQRWRADGLAHPISWPGARVSIRVQSENGRIDINRSPVEPLVGLFEQLFPGSDPQSLADALVDWRDPDDEAEPGGAELADYTAAGYAYGPSNAPFYSINELSQVMGFDSVMLETLKPYLTVYSRQQRINAISADLIVLTAIPGIDRATAQAFVAERETALLDGSNPDFTLLDDGRRYLDTRIGSRLFSLDIEVRLNEGFKRREHAVVRLNRRQGYTLLARETRALDDAALDERQP